MIKRKYYVSPEKRKEYNKKYRQTEKGKNTERRASLKYEKKYRQTKEGRKIRKQYFLEYHKKYPWIRVYSSMIQRCGKDKYYKGTKNLMTLEDVKSLWKRDNAYKMKCPSIDRINSKGDYTILNCRFIEKSENTRRAHLGKIYNGKSVIQLTPDGKEIKKFNSQSEAQRQTGIRNSYISSVARGKKQLAGGYLWQRF